MTEKEIKEVKSFVSANVINDMNDGKLRPSIGVSSIQVGTTIQIPADAVIDSRTRDINGTERTWAFIQGTYPELSLGTLLAVIPSDQNGLDRWEEPVKVDDNRPTLAELNSVLKIAYQPKTRYLPKWIGTEFNALRGKSLKCVARYDYHVDGFETDSHTCLFQIVDAARKRTKKNNKQGITPTYYLLYMHYCCIYGYVIGNTLYSFNGNREYDISCYGKTLNAKSGYFLLRRLKNGTFGVLRFIPY